MGFLLDAKVQTIEKMLNRKTALVDAKKDVELGLAELKDKIKLGGKFTDIEYNQIVQYRAIGRRKMRQLDKEITKLNKEIKARHIEENNTEKKVICPYCDHEIKVSRYSRRAEK